MLNRIIDFSIKNKFAVGLFTVVLIIYGIYNVTILPIDAVPDITNNQVQVITVSPTLATQEVEQFVTYPIERSMSTLPDLEDIRSISRFGLSVVTIVFKDNVDIYFARQLVNERLKEAEGEIPEGSGTPELAPVSTGLGEIYQYLIKPKAGFEDKFNATDLRTIQDWIVARQLLGTPGVAEVNSFGGFLKQYEVAINPEKLRSMAITIPEVFSALQKNNQNTGGAYIEKKPSAYYIRGLGLANSMDDIRKIVVKTGSNGIPVLIRDVATVQLGSAIRYGAMTRDDEGEVVGGIVMMLKGENSAEVVSDVKEKIPQIQNSLPEGVEIEPFLDRTDLVKRAIHTVAENLILGFLIVVFVLILFLGNFRAGLIVASVIPLAMLFAIIMMNLFGVSGNLMSLGAIDFGIIIDGAVIIVEAVVHRIFMSRNHHSGIAKLNREQMDNEVSSAVKGMVHSSSFGQIIILIVYLPILALVGIEGKMFKPMAQTVSFAILGAFLLSITYLPMAASVFLSRKTTHKENLSDKLMNFLHRLYEPLINFTIGNKIKIVITSVAFFAIAFIVYGRLGGEFIPTLDEGNFAFESALPEGASLSQSIETYTQVGKILKQFPEVKEVITKIGSAEIPTDPMPANAGDITVLLKDKSEWVTTNSATELADTMTKALSVIPGLFVEASQPIQLRFNELISGVRQDVAVKIFGENMDTLNFYAEKVSAIIETVNGTGQPKIESTSGLPQIAIHYDRDRIAQYGLNVSDLNEIVRTAFAGESAGLIYENERRFDLVVRLDTANRQSIDDVQNVFVPLPNGGQIPLQQVASIDYEIGPAQITRENAKRRIGIGFNVPERDVKSAVDELQNKLNEGIKLPPGYYFEYGGQFQNLEEASKRLSIAVPVALALIFILLFFTFGNITQCVLVFSAIPLSAIGGVFALWIAGMPFSISAGIGFIALFGVSVLNGIVLIDYFNQLQAQGIDDIYERVIKGTKARFRSVIMTGAVPALGFLPMVISTSAGAEVQKPLATVVIGGLITSTVLTLIVLPALYLLFSGKKKIKVNGSMAAISIFICLGLFSSKINAQNGNSISLDSAIVIALQNNPGVKAKELEIEKNTYLKKASFDLPKTGIFVENEDKSNTDDAGLLKIGITQEVEFPTVYIAKGKINEQNVVISKTELALTQKDLIRDVTIAYYQLYYILQLQTLAEKKDSIFGNYETAALARYESGETNYLESVAAQAKHQEIELELQQITKDVIIYQLGLMRLLNTTDSVLPDLEGAIKINEPAPNIYTTDHPFLNYYQQQMQLSELNKKLAVNNALPDFNIRYFNQNWYGIDDGFKGYSVGIGIPIAFWSYSANIKAAKTDFQIAEKNYEYNQLQFTSAYNSLLQQLDKNKTAIHYYEASGLMLGLKILDAAEETYKAGEAGYFEYMTAVEQYFQIQSGYLQVIHDYNETIINLNYFLNR
ncbi:MAG: CusA/CzcA family heavy metal efflux RND transporter [Chitinophagales bacterium]